MGPELAAKIPTKDLLKNDNDLN